MVALCGLWLLLDMMDSWYSKDTVHLTSLKSNITSLLGALLAGIEDLAASSCYMCTNPKHTVL